MRELTMHEMEEVNGGIPLALAIPAAYLLRKYGGTLMLGALGFAAGWFSE
tara:strand:- start:776 stop:925 length:150 start_codon:yes stop_codon:yes gene_type:complete